ncbi:MAG: DUF2877 domain-containing protein [Acetivibrionales bacterium]|jgi:hypothetical protein
MNIYHSLIAGKRAADLMHSELGGKIFGVYSSSCYCLLDNGEMLLFHDINYGIVPFGIGLQDVGEIIRMVAFKTGMHIYCSNGFVQIPSANTGIYLKSIGNKYNSGQSNKSIVSESVILENLDKVIETIESDGNKNGLGALVFLMDELLLSKYMQLDGYELNFYCRCGFEPLRELLCAVSNGMYKDICNALEKLIGLGPGLTPSMDDLLVGFVYTLNYAQKMGYSVPMGYPYLKHLILNRFSFNTSLISMAYLKCAARGEQFSVLEDVIDAVLCSQYNKNKKSCLKRLLLVGSNSGTDMLVGIALGTALLIKCRMI